MNALVERLFPICRSLTGDGVRRTLGVIGESIPLTIHEVPSGTPAFDWTVPNEWNIRDAYIKDPEGRRVVDFQRSNLHVVGYSAPVHTTLSRQQLETHLHSLPEQPELIPYRTRYYDNDWGFCLSHRCRTDLRDCDYEVCIDSTLVPGSLTYGECELPGTTDDEVLIYTHTCHPSLANDNVSGMAVCTYLAQWLMTIERRYCYRFIFGPGTIGSLVWLSRNIERLPRIRHGLVAVLLGGPGQLRYKRSRQGDAEIDRVAVHALKHSAHPYALEEFSPFGYDERQFGSPGFNLPVGRLSRSPNAGYPEYHTSADNLNLVKPDALSESLAACASILEMIEKNHRYRNTAPWGEPQLGRRGLYRKTGGESLPQREMAMLWILNLSDGSHSLVDIAEISGLDFQLIRHTADDLIRVGLLSAEGVSPARATE
ncbi:MAG: DUF4910 domain-containing protein [Gammaproteobacteria bacterium]